MNRNHPNFKFLLDRPEYSFFVNVKSTHAPDDTQFEHVDGISTVLKRGERIWAFKTENDAEGFLQMVKAYAGIADRIADPTK